MKRKILLSILIVVAVFTITGCEEKKEEKKEEMKEEMSILEKTLNEGNYIVLDVRTKEEYDTGHVKDSVNIPYDEIDENVNLDKSKTILVYCKSGKRSNIAYETLTKLGYQVIDLGAYDKVTLEKE